MAWYKVVSRVPICIDYENGSVVAYPRGAVFEADSNLRDIKLALRGSNKLFAIGVSIPADMKDAAISAPGPSTKPPVKRLGQPKKTKMPRVSYKGKTYSVSEIVHVSR